MRGLAIVKSTHPHDLGRSDTVRGRGSSTAGEDFGQLGAIAVNPRGPIFQVDGKLLMVYPFAATLEDPQKFSKPWTIEMLLYRLKNNNAQ